MEKLLPRPGEGTGEQFLHQRPALLRRFTGVTVPVAPSIVKTFHQVPLPLGTLNVCVTVFPLITWTRAPLVLIGDSPL
jgi:hypothetical protein